MLGGAKLGAFSAPSVKLTLIKEEAHVTHWSRPWRLARCAVPLLAVALVATPLPAFAEESPTATPRPTQATLLGQAQLAAVQIAPTLAATTAQAATPQGTVSRSTDRGSWSFFKSPGGIIVLSTLAVGVGYFIYSTQNDRVSSPGKE